MWRMYQMKKTLYIKFEQILSFKIMIFAGKYDFPNLNSKLEEHHDSNHFYKRTLSAEEFHLFVIWQHSRLQDNIWPKLDNIESIIFKQEQGYAYLIIQFQTPHNFGRRPHMEALSNYMPIQTWSCRRIHYIWNYETLHRWDTSSRKFGFKNSISWPTARFSPHITSPPDLNILKALAIIPNRIRFNFTNRVVSISNLFEQIKVHFRII